MLNAKEVKKGMVGTDCCGNEWTVIKKSKASSFKGLMKYDSAGWITTDFLETAADKYEIDVKKDYLVAVENGFGETAVFTYGMEGFSVE